MQADINW